MSFSPRLGALCLAVVPAPLVRAATDEAALVLFIDDHHVAHTSGVERVFHQPVKHKRPVVLPDRPLEDNTIWIWSAPVWSSERERWQMWYFGGNETLPFYAESRDGVVWEKPSLGLVSVKGSVDNNLIDLGFQAAEPKQNRLVLLRDDRDPDPARRYKGLTCIAGQLKALVSASANRPLTAQRQPVRRLVQRRELRSNAWNILARQIMDRG